jgi:hypothetical protein
MAMGCMHKPPLVRVFDRWPDGSLTDSLTGERIDGEPPLPESCDLCHDPGRIDTIVIVHPSESEGDGAPPRKDIMEIIER